MEGNWIQSAALSRLISGFEDKCLSGFAQLLLLYSGTFSSLPSRPVLSKDN